MTHRSTTSGPRRRGGLRRLALACAAILPLALLPAAAGAQEHGDATASRIAGADRYETAARIANASFDAAEVAVLATGLDFPDALAGSFAAGHLPGPVLLVSRDTVPDATMGMLAELGVARVVLLGGPQAISEEVEQRLDDEGYSPTRVAGSNRYETAAEIALKYGQQSGDCTGGGVSQMGTTFMNVAWFTGVEIPEFRQHTIYFHRYPVCHEATLSWGSLDVVVHNNSPYDIVIDTFYTDDFIGVRYISREWAQVESWEEPDNPPSDGGFSSSCGRTITYPDGTTDTETYSWTYDDTGF